MRVGRVRARAVAKQHAEFLQFVTENSGHILVDPVYHMSLSIRALKENLSTVTYAN
jgi:hypothetical protein